MASRMAARSTTAGTPVKSCSSTRLGMKAISCDGTLLPFHAASARMSSAFTVLPSSRRSRFSSRMRSEYGRCLMAQPCCLDGAQAVNFKLAVADAESGATAKTVHG